MKVELAPGRLDEVLGSDQEEPEDGADEADDRADHEDLVHAADEGDVGGVSRLCVDRRRQRQFGDRARAAGGDRFARPSGALRHQRARASESTLPWKSGAEPGDAGGDTHLPEGRVDARAHPRSLRRDHAIAARPIAGLVEPTPMPATMKPASSAVHSESGPARA